MNGSAGPKKDQRRRRYTEQYKRDAVELWQASGRTAAAIAHELGIRREFLYKWQRQLQLPRGGERAAAALSPEQLREENATLREEVERLREQRDILKKSLGILSETPLRGMPKSKL